MRKLLSVLLIACWLSVGAFAAKITSATFGPGTVILDVNTTGSNLSTFQITNNDPTWSARFAVLDSNGAVIWSFTQPPNSTSPLTNVPTVDNNSNPITWVVGQITLKGGGTTTGVTSPNWQFELVP